MWKEHPHPRSGLRRGSDTLCTQQLLAARVKGFTQRHQLFPILQKASLKLYRKHDCGAFFQLELRISDKVVERSLAESFLS